MDETFQIALAPNVTVTIVALDQRYFWRIHALPPVAEAPLPPEGYTQTQALELVASYKERFQQYERDIAMAQIMRTVGSARLEALEVESLKGDITSESGKLRKLCTRYSFLHPDERDDPLEVGSILTEMAIQVGKTMEPVNIAYMWLREKAGGISHEEVEAWLKSLRPESEQPANGTGSGDSDKAVESGNATAETVVVGTV